VKNKLTPAQYWEWRTTISELDVKKEKLESTKLQLQLLQKESELSAVKIQLFLKTRMELASNAVKDAQTEYDRFKGVLEKCVGQTLSNKIIDEITFEIKEVPK
jgi:hypothetical protein